MPWGYRVAVLFTRLASDLLDTFGRTFAAEFLRLGIVQPEERGTGQHDYDRRLERPIDPGRLPYGYGRDFASRVYKTVLRRIGRPEIAEEAMAQILSKLVDGRMKIRPGVTQREAEAFVLRSTVNQALDLVRAESRQERLVDRDDRQIDVIDPRAFRQLEELLPQAQMKRLEAELRRVHERAPAYVEALLDGLTHGEIAIEWGTSPAYVSKWVRQYGDRLRAVINRHLDLATLAA